MGIEVTKEEEKKLNDLLRKIDKRAKFEAEQQEAAEELRWRKSQPAVTMYAVFDNYTLREWGEHGCEVEGLYLTLDEAVKAIHALREKEKKRIGDMPAVELDGKYATLDYSEWEVKHHYEIVDAPVKSVLKTTKR